MFENLKTAWKWFCLLLIGWSVSLMFTAHTHQLAPLPYRQIGVVDGLSFGLTVWVTFLLAGTFVAGVIDVSKEFLGFQMSDPEVDDNVVFVVLITAIVLMFCSHVWQMFGKGDQTSLELTRWVTLLLVAIFIDGILNIVTPKGKTIISKRDDDDHMNR